MEIIYEHQSEEIVHRTRFCLSNKVVSIFMYFCVGGVVGR